jgi:hypothetical protein
MMNFHHSSRKFAINHQQNKVLKTYRNLEPVFDTQKPFHPIRHALTVSACAQGSVLRHTRASAR